MQEAAGQGGGAPRKIQSLGQGDQTGGAREGTGLTFARVCGHSIMCLSRSQRSDGSGGKLCKGCPALAPGSKVWPLLQDAIADWVREVLVARHFLVRQRPIQSSHE